MRQPTSIAHPSVTLDRAFALVAIFGAGGTAANGYMAQLGFDWPALMGMTAVVLFASSFVGMWVVSQVDEFQRGEVARVYSLARNGARPPVAQREATRTESLGLALQEMAAALWRGATQREELTRWSYDMTRSLAAKRRESDVLSTTLGEDARVIGAAATSAKMADRDLSGRLEAARGHAASAARATDAVAADATQLTDAIRAVTARTEQGTAIATRLAESAFATQRSVTGIGDSAAALLNVAEVVGAALRRAEMVGLDAGMAAAQAGDAGRRLAVVAGDVKSLAQAGCAALDTMLAAVADLRSQTEQALHWVQGVCEAVEAQHELGHALSHAAMLQADAVGRILGRLGAAQTEVGALREQIDGFSRSDEQLGVGMAAQQAVERLPGYAEAMAQILRGLPDFDTSEDAAWRKVESPAGGAED